MNEPEIVPLPKNKQERINYLLMTEREFPEFLVKSERLLLQMKKGGIGEYGTREDEITGLDNNDVSMVYMLLNPTYSELEFDHNSSVGIISREETDDKTVVTVNSQALENKVFYLDSLVNNGTIWIERLFKPNQYLNLALSEIKEAMNESNKYLILKDDIFFYNGYKLEMSHDTLLYKILKNVYIYFDGRSGEAQYKDILKELRKIKELKKKSEDKLKVKIRQDLTSRTMGLGKKLNAIKKNNRHLFETQGGKRLIFNNQKVS